VRVAQVVTDDAPDGVTVERRTAEHRFVVEIGGRTAELTYDLQGDRLFLVHTGVPGEMEQQGIGSALVTAAVEWAAAQHLTVVPLCPFVRWWLRQHPAAAATVTVDWATRTH
jgi:predicted GNAT family acetyltransferase